LLKTVLPHKKGLQNANILMFGMFLLKH
jgi:hypothetical protein